MAKLVGKQRYQIGETIPAESGLELLDAVMGEKMVYQLLQDVETSTFYLTWNATVMAVSGSSSILIPYIEENKRVYDMFRQVQEGARS